MAATSARATTSPPGRPKTIRSSGTSATGKRHRPRRHRRRRTAIAFITGNTQERNLSASTPWRKRWPGSALSQMDDVGGDFEPRSLVTRQDSGRGRGRSSPTFPRSRRSSSMAPVSAVTVPAAATLRDLRRLRSRRPASRPEHHHNERDFERETTPSTSRRSSGAPYCFQDRGGNDTIIGSAAPAGRDRVAGRLFRSPTTLVTIDDDRLDDQLRATPPVIRCSPAPNGMPKFSAGHEDDNDGDDDDATEETTGRYDDHRQRW